MHALLKIVVAAAATACVAYLVWAPGYLDITIPVGKHRGGGGFWYESHRTQLAYADSSGVLYVYRQVGNTSDIHEEHWKTEADVFAYFEAHITRLGWTFSAAGYQSPPAPESALLGAERTRMYYRPGNGWRSTLHLSVWPKQTSGFNVALTTANKSLGMRVVDRLD
jgi:hypothetical protein